MTTLETGSLLQIGSTTTTFGSDEDAARRQFSRFQALSVQPALTPDLLALCLRLLDAATFVGGSPAPGFREVEAPQKVGPLLNLALNRPPLLRWLEQITGCGPLQSIEGRVAQTLNRPGDQLFWHDDLADHARSRRLAIVINFSTQPYTGGEFELRPKGGELLVQHHHTEPGSALIFRVDPSLEHRVLPLTSGGPRRVFAGWACAGEPQ